VSTLEEIRLRKALKASMKRAGYPIQSSDTSANGEMENIRSLFRPTFYEAGDGKQSKQQYVRWSEWQAVVYQTLESFILSDLLISY